MSSLVDQRRSLVCNPEVNPWKQGVAALFLTLELAAFAQSDPPTYQQEFAREVADFAAMNRLNIARLHRDVHADCFIPVLIATTILADGSVKDVSIVKSSSVPVVDRYFRFVIEQAAPYQPLATHYDPTPEELTITQEFRLDVRLWSDGISSERPCDELKPRGSPPDQ
ncbi:MAG: energy transducer TonB [Gammaproteobacteria bacterium]|nr:energy transducer TonB [Gammaproteobacteria bacterium]MDH5311633.1 energy transducer TonB [Gammaproteobacteria bacterium]